MLCTPSNIMNSLFFPYDIYANLIGYLTLVPLIHVYTCSDNKQKRHIHANLVKICQPVKFSSLSAGVTLKIKSRSPKPNQLFTMSQCYIHANVVKIWHLVHELLGKQESFAPMATPALTSTPTGSAPKTILSPSRSVVGHKYGTVDARSSTFRPNGFN